MHKYILIFRPVHSSTKGVFLTLSSLNNGDALFYVLVQTSTFIRIGVVPYKNLNKNPKNYHNYHKQCRSWIYTVKTGLPVGSVERVNTQTWYRSLDLHWIYTFQTLAYWYVVLTGFISPLIDWSLVFNGLSTANVI